jgi:hypothetical protein
MNAWNIKTFIEANQLLQGDAVQIGQLVLGLTGSFLVFMGYDHYGSPMFSGMVNGRAHWIGEQDVARVFQRSAPLKVYRFQGSAEQRNAVMRKANNSLNEDTFNLLLNWSTRPRPKAISKGGGDDFGAAVGGVILGAAVIALIAALFGKDK